MPPDLFEAAADPDLPPAFLRALAYCESGFDAEQVNPASHATGLFQITRPVLQDFNKAHATNHTLDELKEPLFCATVAAGHLRNIIAHWKRTSVALRPAFDDLRFVALLTYGWNAGPSTVLQMASHLEHAGTPPNAITPDAVYEAARQLAPDSFVAMPERLAWAKHVARLYSDLQQGRRHLVAALSPVSPQHGPGPLRATGALAILGLGVTAAAAASTREPS